MINNSDTKGAIKNERIRYMLRAAVATSLSPIVSQNRSGTDVATTVHSLLASAEASLDESAKRLEDSKEKVENLEKDIAALSTDLPLLGV